MNTKVKVLLGAVLVVLLGVLLGCPTPLVPVDPNKGSITVDLRDYFPLIEGMRWESDPYVINGLVDVKMVAEVVYYVSTMPHFEGEGGMLFKIRTVTMGATNRHDLLNLGNQLDYSRLSTDMISEFYIKEDGHFLYRNSVSYVDRESEGWKPWFPIKITTNKPLTLEGGNVVVPQVVGDILMIGGYKFLKGHGPADWKLVNDPRELVEGEGEGESVEGEGERE